MRKLSLLGCLPELGFLMMVAIGATIGGRHGMLWAFLGATIGMATGWILGATIYGALGAFNRWRPMYPPCRYCNTNPNNEEQIAYAGGDTDHVTCTCGAIYVRSWTWTKPPICGGRYDEIAADGSAIPYLWYPWYSTWRPVGGKKNKVEERPI